MRRKLASKSDAGLTLVELAVAVLVLSIGSIAALRALDQSRIAIGGAQDRSFAQLIARNRAEELHLLGSHASLPAAVTMGGQEFNITTTHKTTAAGLTETTVTARSQNGVGALFLIYLPAGAGQ